MKYLLFQISLAFVYSAPLSAQNKLYRVKISCYRIRKLEKCSKVDCTKFLNDTTSMIKLVKYKNQWISLTYPLPQINFNNSAYLFAKDVKPFNTSEIGTMVFNPEGVQGYYVFSEANHFILLKGGFLGATGLSGSYSLIIMIDLDRVADNGKFVAWGGAVKNFTIGNLGCFGKHSRLGMRIGRNGKTDKIVTFE